MLSVSGVMYDLSNSGLHRKTVFLISSTELMPLLCRFKISARPFTRTIYSWTALRDICNRRAPLDVHPEVEEALVNRRAVVALETALVTHGLPYPSSLEVPLALEEIVRSTGSIPATIGVIDGRIKIGLKKDELTRLAERRYKPAKVSRRDIATAITTRSDGGVLFYPLCHYQSSIE